MPLSRELRVEASECDKGEAETYQVVAANASGIISEFTSRVIGK